jgi:hypothetical protein
VLDYIIDVVVDGEMFRLSKYLSLFYIPVSHKMFTLRKNSVYATCLAIPIADTPIFLLRAHKFPPANSQKVIARPHPVDSAAAVKSVLIKVGEQFHLS